MNKNNSSVVFASPIMGFFVVIALLGIGYDVRAQAIDVNCAGCVDSADIANRAVGSAKLKDQAVITRTLKGGAVTRTKLAQEVRDSIDQALGGILLQQVSASDGSGVAALECPTNTLIGSASCFCDAEDQTRNSGVLFSCTVAGNGAVAGCFPEGVTFNPQLPSPLAVLTTICVSGVQNDGTPIEPIFSKGTVLGLSKVDGNSIEFETAVNSARSAAAAHTSKLLSNSQ